MRNRAAGNVGTVRMTDSPGPCSTIGARCPKGSRRVTRTEPLINMKAMSQPVSINENGKRKTISKLAAAVTQLANDAARGDKKSIQLIIALLQAFEPTIEAQRPKEVIIYSGVLAEDDRMV